LALLLLLSEGSHEVPEHISSGTILSTAGLHECIAQLFLNPDPHPGVFEQHLEMLSDA